MISIRVLQRLVSMTRFLFELTGSRSEEATALFASCSRWRKAEQFLNVLSNGHRAQNVEENE